MNTKLIYKGQKTAALFVWVSRDRGCIRLSTAREELKLSLSDETGRKTEVKFAEDIIFETSGVYRLSIFGKSEAEITVESGNGAYPFLVNGPGVLPRTEMNQSVLWFPKGERNVFIAVPEETELFSVSYFGKGMKNVTVSDGAGDEVSCRWLPDVAPWHVEDFTVLKNSGYWRFDFDGEDEFRVNECCGLAMFLEKPDRKFIYNYFTVKNSDGLDFRLSIMRDGHIDAVYDILYNENKKYPVVAGEADFVFSAGFSYKTVTVNKNIKGICEFDISFTKTLNVPEGWLRGDLHVHSCYEDACSTPQRITKAGRCNGLDFMFLTDHGGKKIIDNGLCEWREEGRFLPVPGQECVNERTHMNFLNVPFDIDYKGKTEREWLDEAKEKNPCGNLYASMLNHPSHLPESQKGWWCTYFRSWWVATECKDVELVENFDMITWYDCLTRGRHLTGIWTTDTHDGTVEKPGNGCSFVFTDGQRSENAIVAALKAGRVTNSFSVGAFLNLTADGGIIGDTVKRKSDAALVKVQCSSNIQMDRIELIGNGTVLKTWNCGDSLEFSAECSVNPDEFLIKGERKWIIAVMYHKDHDYKVTQDSQFIENKIGAFTNPIYIK